eukprot:m.589003 g.589003  ORF g.589003 m.589003 type:complete len:152 (+) comp58005_c0_seq3:1059-1514(+)
MARVLHGLLPHIRLCLCHHRRCTQGAPHYPSALPVLGGLSFSFSSPFLFRFLIRPSSLDLSSLCFLVSCCKKKLSKKVYDALTWAVTMFVLDYMVGPFVLYDIERSLKMFGAFYYIPHIAAVVIVVLFPSKDDNEKPKKAATNPDEVKKTE